MLLFVQKIMALGGQVDGWVDGRARFLFAPKSTALGGWVDGWMDGWMAELA